MYVYYTGVYPKLIPIPSHFFKLVMAIVKPNPDTATPGVINVGAFILPNTENDYHSHTNKSKSNHKHHKQSSTTSNSTTTTVSSMDTYVIALHELEMLTGISFFSSGSVLYSVDKVVYPWKIPTYTPVLKYGYILPGESESASDNSSSNIIKRTDVNKAPLKPPPLSPLATYIIPNSLNIGYQIYEINHICHGK